MKRISVTTTVLLPSLLLFLFTALLAAQQTTTPLNDSQIYTSSISSGGLQHYYFSAATLQKRFASALQPHLDKRAPSVAYLSLTSCSQPAAPAGYEGDIPSLDMYISTSNDNTLPGPNQGQMANDSYPGRLSWQGEISELWIGVVAPTLTNDWEGNWTFQIAISTQQFVHPLLLSQNNGNIPYLMLDDTDQTHALFLTKSGQQNASVLLTRNIPPELNYSLCAAENYRVTNYTVNITQTTRGFPGSTWQQVEAANLTSGTTYTAYYIQSVGAFTGISAPIKFVTKIDGNCRLIYGLDFCDEVAYSVPADASLDINAVKNGYDSQAQTLFEPFNVAISQFNCETTRYSLVRNCTDCYNDYKRWLCAVAIPRCTSTINGMEDDIPQQSSSATAARALRAVNVNESRNPWIDENMNPGGWIELLPCIDLCYFVVQSCPPFMQFNCPTGDLARLQYGYWRNISVNSNDQDFQFGINLPTCNRLDANEGRLVLSKASNTLQTRFSFIISTIAITLVIMFSYT